METLRWQRPGLFDVESVTRAFQALCFGFFSKTSEVLYLCAHSCEFYGLYAKDLDRENKGDVEGEFLFLPGFSQTNERSICFKQIFTWILCPPKKKGLSFLLLLMTC